jgi:DNA adenine methylase
MNLASPLRYPGGKSAMAGLLRDVRKLNGLGNHAIAEPFAGGAGASLNLLFLEEAPDIFINDADPAIFDLWWSILNRTSSFTKLVANRRVSIAEWRRQRDVYRQQSHRSRLRRGFSAFYLNRCNRSGIIMNGGPIGGIRQTGKWKLNARYNKDDLIRRCTKIAEFKSRIEVSGKDGIEFIQHTDASRVFYFIDPPYFHKGKTLYLNGLTPEYHGRLAKHLKTIRKADWLLTYDDCPEIRAMYRGWTQIKPFKLRYAAAERRSGKELLIAPMHMNLPSQQSSNAIIW